MRRKTLAEHLAANKVVMVEIDRQNAHHSVQDGKSSHLNIVANFRTLAREKADKLDEAIGRTHCLVVARPEMDSVFIRSHRTIDGDTDKR